MSGGLLRLSAATNINTAGGATLTTDSISVLPSILSITGNFAAPGLTAGSSGILAVDTSTYTQDPMAGNSMFVGSFSGGTITRLAANPLTAGTGNTYRFGGGSNTNNFWNNNNYGPSGQTLTVSNGILTGGNNLVVGDTAPYNSFINLVLSSANTYSGTTTVNYGSTLQGTAQTSGSPFGTTSGINLLGNGRIRINGIASSTNTALGTLTLNGAGLVQVNQADTTHSVQATITGSMPTRSATTPYVFYVQGSNNGNTDAGTLGYLGGNEKVVLTGTAPTVTNGMVAPYILGWSSYDDAAEGDFLTYGANGFAKATYTANPTLSGSGTANAANIVNLTAGQALTGTETVDVYALRLSNSSNMNITGSSAFLQVGKVVALSCSVAQSHLAHDRVRHRQVMGLRVSSIPARPTKPRPSSALIRDRWLDGDWSGNPFASGY